LKKRSASSGWTISLSKANAAATQSPGSGVTRGFDFWQSGGRRFKRFRRASESHRFTGTVQIFDKFLTRIIRFGALNEPFCSHPP
jgi:hypothetical protein